MPRDNLHNESFPGLTIKGDLFSLKNKKSVTPGFVNNSVVAAKSPKFAEALAWSFRDVFGHAMPVDPSSWGEYLRCTRCGAQRSIEEYYTVTDYSSLQNLEISTPIPQPCPTLECTGKLSVFYSQEVLVHQLRTRMKTKAFSCSLALNAAEQVVGFCYGWVDSLYNIWLEHAHHFGVDHPSDNQFLCQVEQSTQGKLTAETEVFFTAEIGISVPYRDPTLAKELNRLMFSSIPPGKQNLTTVSLSQPDKMGYVFLESSGHSPVFSSGSEDMTLMMGTVTENIELWSLPYGYYKNRCKPAVDRWKARLNAKKAGSKPLAQAS
ncbi:MAG: hypothetical protein OQJ97_01235 [Rhodospirillales bacterium]|nr:hypothetical protein [Rhodospirillales bacterium]